ncbi:class I SAM-dependent methyltransferase [Candidatus Woesearchaeota archaeon]|nr:class I SAM-dependent methyltransferase [Candidatus Woesearchaeota archaeon]
MEISNQKEVWENIAEEWNKFKTSPAEHVIKFLEGKKGKILDLGSGSGRNLIKRGDLEYFLLDFSKKMIKFAKEKCKKLGIKANFYIQDMTKLPFEDNFFDAALCISSLHCVQGQENREKVIQELYRVLKPNTEVDVSVWNKNSYRFKNSNKERIVNWRDKGERYYYLFEDKEIYNLFERNGFEIIFKEEPTRAIVFIAKKVIK